MNLCTKKIWACWMIFNYIIYFSSGCFRFLINLNNRFWACRIVSYQRSEYFPSGWFWFFMKMWIFSVRTFLFFAHLNNRFWACRTVSYWICGNFPSGCFWFFMYLMNFELVWQLAIEDVDIFCQDVSIFPALQYLILGMSGG